MAVSKFPACFLLCIAGSHTAELQILPGHFGCCVDVLIAEIKLSGCKCSAVRVTR